MPQPVINSSMGQQMAQAAQPGAQAAPPAAPPQPSPQQIDQKAQSQPASHDDAQDGHPVGTVGDQQNAQDPSDQTSVTATEQAQYVQLVSRFIMTTHSMMKGPHATHSPADATLQQLNNPKISIVKSVGNTTANALFYLHNLAKAHGVDYDPDVMFHACDECVVAIYLMGQAAKIFKGTPPYQPWDGKGPYPFTAGEQNLLARAKMVSVTAFGALMQHSGQINEQERSSATQFWQQQIHNELASGKVDPQILQDLHKSGLANRVGGVAPPQGSSPPASPAPPATAPAAAPPAAPDPSAAPAPAGIAPAAGAQ